MDDKKKEMECVPGGCEFYDPEEDRCTAFECYGLKCSPLPCEIEDNPVV